MTPASGAVLGGRYRLTTRIAIGGMGEVWRAVDERLHRDVAVKVLPSALAADPTFLERFRAEARHTAALTHPSIAQVYDYGEDDAGSGPLAFLVMELVPGEALSGVLRREGRLDAARTLEVVRQTAQALAVAHAAGVIHRDIKPGNLLVTPEGAVKVTDFGIARAGGSAALTQTGTIMGTAHYLSPEQANGQAAGPPSDLYALGVVAYECLAGSRPFVGDNPVTVALAHVRETPPTLPGDVPAAVRELVEDLLSKEPAERPGDAAAVAARAAGLRSPDAPDVAGLATRPVPLADIRASAADSTRLAPAVAGAAGAGVGSAAAQLAGPPDATPDDDGRRRRTPVVLAALALGAALLVTWLALGNSADGEPRVPTVPSLPAASSTTSSLPSPPETTADEEPAPEPLEPTELETTEPPGTEEPETEEPEPPETSAPATSAPPAPTTEAPSEEPVDPPASDEPPVDPPVDAPVDPPVDPPLDPGGNGAGAPDDLPTGDPPGDAAGNPPGDRDPGNGPGSGNGPGGPPAQPPGQAPGQAPGQPPGQPQGQLQGQLQGQQNGEPDAGEPAIGSVALFDVPGGGGASEAGRGKGES